MFHRASDVETLRAVSAARMACDGIPCIGLWHGQLVSVLAQYGIGRGYSLPWLSVVIAAAKMGRLDLANATDRLEADEAIAAEREART